LLESLNQNSSRWKTNSGVILLACLAQDPKFADQIDTQGLAPLLSGGQHLPG
jgi:hypothetical protein